MLVLQSLLFGLLICLIAAYAKFRWNRRRMYELAAKIPGPSGLPFIGIGHKFLNTDCKSIFKLLTTMTKDYPSPNKVWLGPQLVIFADTPESLQVVLNSPACMDKSPLYDRLVLTKGLVISNGQTWKHHRKVLIPSFRLSALQNLVPTFDQKSKIMVKNMEAELQEKEFDVYAYTSACSLETLMKGTMEIDRDIQTDPRNNKYLHDLEATANLMMKKIVNIFYHFKRIYRMSKLYQLEKIHVHEGIFKIADEVIEEHLGKSSVSGERDDEIGSKNMSFIRALMDARNGLTHDEIWDEINVFIAGGHETSALLISNAILMLAMHPEIQQKAVQEQREVFSTADEVVDFESLNKLTYLEMVVKETMRLFPVLPILGRKSTEEFDIGNCTIPVGATIVISSFTVQRDKKYWGEDASEFRPERFEPDSFKKVPAYAYIPFTGGPRICIGWRYGMLFVKSVLSNFLRNFEAKTNLKYEELEYELSISLKIVQRCMVRVTKREF